MKRMLIFVAIASLIACSSPPPAKGDYTLNRSRVHAKEARTHDRKARRGGNTSMSHERAAVVAEASSLVGAKYRYGGDSPSRGFDCSGFTSYVWSRFNVNLPRSSSDQARLGRKKPLRDATEGDLIFFGTGTRVTHVGIVVAHDRSRLEIVHSTSGDGVRLDEVYSSRYWSSRVLWAVDLGDIL